MSDNTVEFTLTESAPEELTVTPVMTKALMQAADDEDYLPTDLTFTIDPDDLWELTDLLNIEDQIKPGETYTTTIGDYLTAVDTFTLDYLDWDDEEDWVGEQDYFPDFPDFPDFEEDEWYDDYCG